MQSRAHPTDEFTTGPRDSRALANPVGGSLGIFCQKGKSTLMPLSPGKSLTANPLPSLRVRLGFPGGRHPPGWPLIRAQVARFVPYKASLK